MGHAPDPLMHTAEHILNQTMVRLLGTGRCFTAHLGKKKSKCDYRFSRDLTAEEVRAVEDKVNEAIRADLAVTEEFLPRPEAEKEFDLARLPDEAGDRVRVIRVGEYDACPCIGVHAASSGELGGFRIVSTTFEDGVLRLRFKLSPP